MILIVDSFLDEKDFIDLKEFSKSKYINYSTKYFAGSKEKTDATTYGLRHTFSIDSQLGKCLSKQCVKKI